MASESVFTVNGTSATPAESAEVPQGYLALFLIENLADPVYAASRIGAANGIVDSAQPEASQEVWQVLGPILNCDDLRDCERPSKTFDHDPVLGLLRKGDDELAAVAEVSCLGEVVERLGRQGAGIKAFEQTEHLQQHGLRPGCHELQVVYGLVE